MVSMMTTTPFCHADIKKKAAPMNFVFPFLGEKPAITAFKLTILRTKYRFDSLKSIEGTFIIAFAMRDQLVFVGQCV